MRQAKASGGCGIVLTTVRPAASCRWLLIAPNANNVARAQHSMQEAEELTDHIGIIKNGTIMAKGTPVSLVSAHGNYLSVHLSLPPSRHADATALLRGLAPSLVQKVGLGGTVEYELPGQECTVQQVFAAITSSAKKLEVEDWGVQNSSLEDVFVKLYSTERPEDSTLKTDAFASDAEPEPVSVEP